MPLTLQNADRLSEKIVAELNPFCAQIVTAGSIRRRRPHVNDIDIVVLPKPGQLEPLLARCAQKAIAPTTGGTQYRVFTLAGGVQLDLWIAYPAGGDLFEPLPCNFGVLLLARTGSAQFNVWLATECHRHGLHFNPHKGITRGHQVIAAATEAELFDVLKLDFISPEKRER